MKDGKHKKQRSQVNLKQQPPVKVKRPTGCTPGQWTIKTGPGLSLTNSLVSLCKVFQYNITYVLVFESSSHCAMLHYIMCAWETL